MIYIISINISNALKTFTCVIGVFYNNKLSVNFLRSIIFVYANLLREHLTNVK